MKLDYTVRKEIEIPDDRMEELVAYIVEKWGLDSCANIHAEDLLNQAVALNIIKLPDNWHSADDSFTQAELLAVAKKKKRKK